MRTKRRIILDSLVALGLPLFLGLVAAPAGAQPVAPPPEAIILPKMQFSVPPAQVRTWEAMEAADALAPTGPARPAREAKRFRPTIGDAAYQTEKAKAALSSGQRAPAAPAIQSPLPQAPTILSKSTNFDGVNSSIAGGSYPPDTEGAVGLSHYVEVTNEHVDVYPKAANPSPVKSVSLSSFFGYSSQSLFDPRVLYDPGYNRWVIIAAAFAESTTVTKLFYAVSQTADPTGSFFINSVNVSDGNNALWDFPQVGMDHQAIIFTGNLFDGPNYNNYIDARMFTVAKSVLYSGQSFNLQLLTGLAGPLTPPLVLDVNPNTYLVSAAAGDNKVTLYTLTNSATAPALTKATIPVPAYTTPPNAPQSGTTSLLDTSDCRFVNVSTQIGNSLFQVHTINIGGRARPRFYEFDPVKLQVIQSGTFSRSSTSYDFNASIAANRHKDIFVNWSATDTGVNAEVRFSGRLHSDAPGVIPSPGSLLFGSTSDLTADASSGTTIQRWGDYSAVSLDPADPSGATAWIVNERILSTASWGSRIGRIVLPLHIPLPGVNLLLLDQ